MSLVLVVPVLGVAAVLAIVIGMFVLGFEVGGRFWQSELQRSRFETARAERQLHDLTRDAFVAMADHVDPDRRTS